MTITETLHPSLRPFAVELNDLDPAVSTALAPLLLRVLAALSSTAPNVHDADGDPDGYAGFQRRGPYERLVMSEWALLDEVPDEFLRRAANAEHFFYELERVSPKRAGVVVALFDVGGDQLGRPRLAQLATLIVLAARARARHATLQIGVLQETATTLLPWSMHALRTLQTARHRDNADAEDHARWATKLTTVVDVDVDVEVVVVGGARSRRWPRATFVQLDDIVDVDTRALGLRVHEGEHAARTALLPLPDDATCVRVLRDPLGRRAPATPKTTTKTPKKATSSWRIDPTQPLQMSVDGGRVLARLNDGAVLSCALPTSTATPPTNGRLVRPLGTVVAAEGIGRNMWLVVVDDDGRVLVQRDGSAPVRLATFLPPVASTTGFGRLAIVRHTRTLYFTDRQRDLFRVDLDSRRLERVASNASIIANANDGGVMVMTFVDVDSDERRCWSLHHYDIRDGVHVTTGPITNSDPPPRLFPIGQANHGCAIHDDDGRFAVWPPTQMASNVEVNFDVGEVAAIFALPSGQLVVVRRTSVKSLVLSGAVDSRVVLSSPIEQLTIATRHRSPQLVCLTETGELRSVLLPSPERMNLSLDRVLVRAASAP